MFYFFFNKIYQRISFDGNRIGFKHKSILSTGGLAAVVLTDTLQTVVMLVGAVVMAIICKNHRILPSAVDYCHLTFGTENKDFKAIYAAILSNVLFTRPARNKR